MLMTAYSASIGGVLTPIGTPPNLIMLGFLDSMQNIHVSFFEWMIWGFLAMVFYFAIAYVVLSKMFPADINKIDGAEEFIRARQAELGSWTRAQKNTLCAFMLAVALWIIPSFLNIFTITWKEASGGMMYKTGLSQWLGDLIVDAMGGSASQVILVAVFSVMALILSELTSHTAATNMIEPLAITIAVSAGLSPVPVSVGIALSASLGFMLPVSTPPNAIVYASGYVPITKMIKAGVYIDFIGIAFVTIPLAIWLVGLIVG